jgi:hypothetical protein
LIVDDGGSTHLWNVGRQWIYTAVYPRRQLWTCSALFICLVSKALVHLITSVFTYAVLPRNVKVAANPFLYCYVWAVELSSDFRAQRTVYRRPTSVPQGC